MSAMQRPMMSLVQEQRLQMVLAPQLRQSLEMLQVPVFELQALIQKELEQNPTLEVESAKTEQVEIEPGKKTRPVKHLHEAFFYTLSGYGSTTVWLPMNPRPPVTRVFMVSAYVA